MIFSRSSIAGGGEAGALGPPRFGERERRGGGWDDVIVLAALLLDKYVV